MNISTNKLATPLISLQPSSHKQNIEGKMTAALQSSHLPIAHTNQKPSPAVNLSSDEKMKIDSFINELQKKDSEKEFFAYVFKTIIHLGKSEKEKFIAGVSQSLNSSQHEGSSLNERFNKALRRYMSVSLMSTPLSTQLSDNMSKFSLDGDDDDIELI